MLHSLFSTAVTLLLLAGFVPYLRDVLAGRTVPERASWLIWSVLGAVAFSAQYALGSGWSLFLAGGDLAGCLAVLLLSLPYGTGGLLRRDLACLAAALAGLLIWHLTSRPLLALLIIIGIDAMGGYLTIAKLVERPGSETLASWTMVSLAGCLGALSELGNRPEALLWPLYVAFVNGAVCLAVLWTNVKRQKPAA